jgi:tetratricopeptide (TPR) repeat protein
MKNKEIEAINKLNNIISNIGPQNYLGQEISNNVQILVQGFQELKQEVKEKEQVITQKEQLLVQREKELERLKSITDNSSKVARDIISESKQSLDKAVSLYQGKNFSEALKYSDMALYTIGDINSLGVKTVEAANELYLQRLEQYKESSTKRDNLYNSSVVNDVNAFAWAIANPSRDFYSFFKEVLKVPTDIPDNIRIIKKLYENIPQYLEEAKRANYFYNEYNKYYDALLKLQQVVNIHNIRAASSKGLKDYEEALKSCDIALEIEPTSATLLNLKNAILEEKQVVETKKLEEEKLLAGKDQEIEKLKEQLAQKEDEVREKSLVKNQQINELQIQALIKELALKDKALEDAREIMQQKQAINDLHEKLLTLVDLQKKAGIFDIELSVIAHQVEESIAIAKIDEMSELSKHLDELIKQNAEKGEPVELSKILDDLSPTHHSVEVNNGGIVDFSNVHTTHSSMIELIGNETNLEAESSN